MPKTLSNSLSKKDKPALLARLARIEGQVRGIHEMVERGEDCEQIAQQLAAVRGALQKAFSEMMACAIKHHLSDADEEEAQKLNELTQILSKYG